MKAQRALKIFSAGALVAFLTLFAIAMHNLTVQKPVTNVSNPVKISEVKSNKSKQPVYTQEQVEQFIKEYIAAHPQQQIVQPQTQPKSTISSIPPITLPTLDLSKLNSITATPTPIVSWPTLPTDDSCKPIMLEGQNSGLYDCNWKH